MTDPKYAALLRLRSRHRSLLSSKRESDRGAAEYIQWQLARLGLLAGDLGEVHIDHVVPISLAASDPSLEGHVLRWENLVVTPASFNLSKGDALPSYGYLRYRDALVEEYLKVLA
jgi:5-methylcytosine-specific restriction endonuclease McrA